MWNLDRGGGFLPSISLQKLRNAYEIEQNARAKVRLLCAIHRKQGERIDAIMRMANLSKSTVHDILHRFAERGIAGKDGIKQSGRPCQLTLAQRKDLAKRLLRGPPNDESGLWTTKEVRAFIKEKYGVEYAHAHIWLILKAGGFSMQKPRNRHYKAATPQVKADFKKRLPGWHAIIGRKAS